MNYAVVTPIWRSVFSKTEYENITVTLNSLSEVDHYFVYPENLELSYYQNAFQNSKFIPFHKKCFESVAAYSRMMLLSEFYRLFLNYDGIVICQSDALMLQSIPECVVNYDYIGAPWSVPFQINLNKINGSRYLGWLLSKIGASEKIAVGNGGLSWRKIQKFKLISEILDRANIHSPVINEDLVIGYLGAIMYLNIPDPVFAEAIFLEEGAEKHIEIPNVVGFHAIEKYNPVLRKKIVNARI